MMAYAYPYYAMHKSVHDSFRYELDGMELALGTKGFADGIAIKLDYLIVNWFMNHIKVEDNKLCRFLEVRALELNEVLSDKLDVIAGAFFKGGTGHYASQHEPGHADDLQC